MTTKFTKGMEYAPQKGDWFVWRGETYERLDHSWRGTASGWLTDSQVLDLLNAGIIEINREVKDGPFCGEIGVIEFNAVGWAFHYPVQDLIRDTVGKHKNDYESVANRRFKVLIEEVME